MWSCCSPDLSVQLLAPRMLPVTCWRDAEVQMYQTASTPWTGAGVSHCPQKGSSEHGFVGRASPAPVVPLLFHLPLIQNRKIPAFNTKQHQQAEVLLLGRCPGSATHNHNVFCSSPVIHGASLHSRVEAPRVGRMGMPLVKLETLKLLIFWRNS